MFRPRKTQKQIEEDDEEAYFRDNEDDATKDQTPAKPDEPQFKEMPKKEEQEVSRFGQLAKKKEGETRKATPRKIRDGKETIKFKLGGSIGSDQDSRDASGSGLVDYNSDEEEKKEIKVKEEEKEKETEGETEGEGNGQVRERNGDTEPGPVSKKIKTMDEREEFAKTPPLET